ncbi:MAG TPA: hypothetical protein PKV72_04250 [Candidatus Peribacteria bacterium]|nr:hypothetical protein [Candidatus Peribacteria bacterium]
MKRTLPLVLGFIGLSLLAACGANNQLAEVHAYLTQVQPIGESLNKEGEAFTVAMQQEGAPDQVALGSIHGSLQTSLDTLKGVTVADPALLTAHEHLLKGIAELQEGVDALVAVLKDPTTAPADFETSLDAKMTSASKELDEWKQGVAALLPEGERADFLKDVQ